MMGENKRIIALGVSLLPLVFVFVMFPVIPEAIPTRIGLGGVIRHGNRTEIFILPGLAVAIQLLWVVIEKVMRQKESGIQNVKMLFWCNLMVTLLFSAATVGLAYAAIDGVEELDDARFDIQRIYAVVFSIMCIGIGNLLPKCKQNRLIGIRFKRTLNCKHNWFKTHRFGGKAYIIFGIISTILCLFVLSGQAGLFFIMAGIMALLIVIYGYSNYIYKLESTNK